VRLRRHLLSALEHATAAGPAAAPINVVVAGGGPTGVETAGALTSMARELAGPAVTLRVTLVEATSRLLNGFSTTPPRPPSPTCSAAASKSASARPSRTPMPGT
jgi:NADH dehydrogenase FAD-containing subunit